MCVRSFRVPGSQCSTQPNGRISLAGSSRIDAALLRRSDMQSATRLNIAADSKGGLSHWLALFMAAPPPASVVLVAGGGVGLVRGRGTGSAVCGGGARSRPPGGCCCLWGGGLCPHCPTGNAGSKKLHILRTGQSVSRICFCDPTGITSDGVEDLTRIKGCSTAAHCTVSGQSISCNL